jgi:hypothetical protein
MSRYVDADAVRAAIVNAREAALEHKPYGWEWEINGYNGAILAAGRVPAADVRPVKRGEWLEAGKSSLFPDDTIYGCSVCDYKYFVPHKFCPNCGADMRPKEDNDG